MRINPNMNHATILKEQVNNNNNIEKNETGEVFNFENALEDAQVVNSQNVIQELIHKFEIQEKIVLKNPTMLNIGEYKRIIKDLLNIASQNYKCEDINVYSADGFQKNLSLSKVIDDKLNSVVEDFMNTNKLSLESVAMMEDIKGLILNVFV